MEMILLSRFFKYVPGNSISRIQNEAKSEGIKISLVRPTEVRLREREVGHETKVGVRYLNQPWINVDLVVPLLRHDDDYGWDVLQELAAINQRVLRVSRVPQGERARMEQLFGGVGLVMPQTFIGDRSLIWRNRTTMPWPLIVRARIRSGQRMVRKVANWNMLDDCLHEYESVVEEPMFLIAGAELEGDYVSTLMVGNDVVCAILRPNGMTEIGATGVRNPSRGMVSATPLSIAEIEMLRKIRKVYGAVFAAVDFVRGPYGPRIVEVNTAPNLTQYEEIAGQNFAKMVVRIYRDLVIGSKVQAQQK